METGDAETAAEWYASEYVRQVEEGSPPSVATFLSRVPEEDRPDCRRLIEQFLHLRHLLDGAGAEFALVPGRSLGAYRVRSKLGSGGMGTVYLAEPAADLRGLEKGQQVALKVIHPHLLAEPGFFKRFLREAELGKRVRHPNVVRTYEADAVLLEDRQVNFLVMEHVEGQTLRSLLQELGRVPEELCRHIGREVARALQAVHAAGAVHRDLKPENILITPEEVVKLMDLGVARLADEVIRLSQTGGFVGSVAYAAPEQFQAAPDSVDERADLYALGLVLYELATGTHPFAGDDLRNVMQRQIQEDARPAAELNPQLSPFFEEALKTLLDKAREGRFASAAVLLEVLEEGEQSGWWQRHAQTLRAVTQKPLRRMRIPRETALYGRDEELERLDELFQRAKASEGQVVLVEGEAGIGKTRLVDDFVGRLHQAGEDVNFLFGAYAPGGAATAAGAFSTAYREFFGEEGLDETLCDYLTAAPNSVPAFAALLRGEAAPGVQPLSKDALQAAFAHATRALAAERPTIVLIDDLHFAPAEGKALFLALTLAVPDRRVLLVGTTRRGIPENWLASVERLDYAARIPLLRLTPKDLAPLLVDAFRSERLADDLGWQIAIKSDGNPFFAIEIVLGLREGRYITQQPDGSWIKGRVIENITIPSSVVDLIQARIAALEEADRDLLDIASCCGYEFDPGLMGEALGVGVLPALKRFGRIEKEHRLIRSIGRRCIFDHHQVQETLYTGMLEQLREHYHGAVGAALERREGAGSKPAEEVEGAVAAVLCEHFLKAAQGDRALRYLRGALSHLEKNYLNDAAIRLADRALDTPGLLTGRERLQILLHKAGRLELLARREEQLATLEEAVLLSDEVGDADLRAKSRRLLGEYYLWVSRYAEARGVLEDALIPAREAGVAGEEMEILDLVGRVFHALGRLDDAEDSLRRSLAVSREIEDPFGSASATAYLGMVARDRGEYAEAVEYCSRSVAFARSSGDRRVERITGWIFGYVLTGLGRHEDARVHAEHALRISREIGDQRGESLALGTLGMLHHASGEPERAKEYYERALTGLEEMGFLLVEGLARLLLGQLELQQGHVETAASHVARAAEVGREIDAPAAFVPAGALLACLNPDGLQPALAALSENESRLDPSSRMLTRFLIYRATSDPAHVEEAHRILQILRERAPEIYRESMVERVPLHREIVAAWKRASESGSEER